MPPRIPECIGWQIVGLRRAGFTQNEISCDLNIRQGTVSKILRRHSQRRTVKPKVSSGRPRKTPIRDDRILYRICRSNRMKSASVLRQMWQNRINNRLSRATVNRRSLSRGLKACRSVQRPLLNDLRKQRRLLWAQQHRRYGLRHWRHVIYTDESRFLLHRSDGKVCVRQQHGSGRTVLLVLSWQVVFLFMFGAEFIMTETLTRLCYKILSTATDIDNYCKQSLSYMLDNASEEIFCFSITLRHIVRT